MVSAVWVILMVGGITVAAVEGRMPLVTAAVVGGSAQGVELAFGFVGIMALWLGLARVAEASGLFHRVGRIVGPFFARLFPGLDPDHPAIGSMWMNVAANMLGMGGAATPFGLKAMSQLAEDNPDPTTASDQQITFIAINTAALNLVPATVIALRVAAGSKNPTEIVAPTIVVTSLAMVVAIVADRILRRLFQGKKR